VADVLQLLLEDELVDLVPAAAAVLDRPGQAEPAPLGQLGHERRLLRCVPLRERPLEGDDRIGVLLQEPADLVPELLDPGGKREVHRLRPGPSRG
jgi:hypothetical protein